MQRLAGVQLKPLQTQHHGLTEEARFLKWVDVKDAAQCWNWKGSRKWSGWHGQWRNKAGEIELAHRASWRLFKSFIPEGMYVLHKCDNPDCVNPTHLFLGSQADNLHDMWGKGRAKPGLVRGVKHGMSKLTPDAVREIRLSKMTGVELAAKFSVSPTTVCDVRKRRIWDHI